MTSVLVSAIATALLIGYVFWLWYVASQRAREAAAAAKLSVEREVRLATILESAVDGIITINDRGMIESANPSACHIFNYDVSELIGKNVSMLMPEPDRSLHDTYLAKYKSTGQASIIGVGREVVGKRQDGSLFPMELAVSKMMLNGQTFYMGLVHDISVRKMQERIGRENALRWQFALEGSGNGVWDWNTKTNEVFYSRIWKQMLGYDDKDIDNSLSAWEQRIHPVDKERVKAELMAHLEGVIPFFVTEHRVCCKDSNYLWVLVRGMVIERDCNNNALRVIGTCTDISEQKRVEQELFDAKEAAERANRAKSEFLSRMSHELRTPMNAVLGYTQLLQIEGDLSDSQRENLTEIYTAGKHLLQLINETLDLSKIEAGHIELNINEVDLIVLLKEVVMLVKPIEMHYGIHVQVGKIASVSSILVLADPTRLKQVLINLLSNAIKYSRKGGVVKIHCTSVAARMMHINIIDSGEGITPEKISELFTPYHRMGAEHSGIEGTGIGLTITKQLVELMGGKIGVESQVGLGSCFWIELPLAAATLTNNKLMGL